VLQRSNTLSFYHHQVAAPLEDRLEWLRGRPKKYRTDAILLKDIGLTQKDSHRAQSWWYGDLANARERDYGSLKEMAARQGINYNSLHNYQSVDRSLPNT
jgi:hypothetical protein